LHGTSTDASGIDRKVKSFPVPFIKCSVPSDCLSRDVALAAAIPNINTWAKAPRLYEIGSTTVPRAIYSQISHLPTIERGRQLIEIYGSASNAMLQGFRTPLLFRDTISSGLTPGAWLLVIGLLEAGETGYTYANQDTTIL
jgi:hypothetical protein